MRTEIEQLQGSLTIFYLAQRKALVKPALMVGGNGYILDIHGLYFSHLRKNDAAMLRNEFNTDGRELANWLEEEDVFIIDKSYPDIIPFLTERDTIVKMQHSVQRGQRQLSTEKANANRIITKLRWIVDGTMHLDGYYNTHPDLL